MKDNLSIVITIIILVLLMVIFPLYNFFERQDDMSYNLVLKATTNFADQVMNNGYIDQNTYDKFVTELANTGNVYDIQIEAHRKILVDAGTINSKMSYVEQSYVDYSDDIFDTLNNTSTTDSNLMLKSIKNDIYLLNPKDEIYVKVKNSNTTMAGSLFNTIVPASKKDRIAINYGGIIKNNAWKDVDARYTGHSLAPGAPSLKLKNADNTDVTDITNTEENPYYKIPKSKIIDNGYKIVAESTAFEGLSISKYFWKITDIDDSSKEKVPTLQTSDLQEIGDFIEDGHRYRIEVYAVNSAGYKSDSTNINIQITNESNTAVETSIKGDLTNDSNLDDSDLIMLRDYLDNNLTFTSDVQKEKADINGDNNITQLDFDYLKELVENGYILGDINKDYKIKIEDVTLIQNHIGNRIVLDEEQQKIADINKDGNIDSNDVILLQQKIT